MTDWALKLNYCKQSSAKKNLILKQKINYKNYNKGTLSSNHNITHSSPKILIQNWGNCKLNTLSYKSNIIPYRKQLKLYKKKLSINPIQRLRDNWENYKINTLSSNLNITLYRKLPKLYKNKFNMKLRLSINPTLKRKDCYKEKYNNLMNSMKDITHCNPNSLHCSRKN